MRSVYSYVSRGALVGLMVALSACTQPPVAPKSPDQVLFTVQVTLDGLVKQADLYAKLPRCGAAGATALCSEQAVAAKAYAAGVRTQEAINSARVLTTAYGNGKVDLATVMASVNAANTLLGQVQDIVASLKSQ